jgi:TolA-binding protein
MSASVKKLKESDEKDEKDEKSEIEDILKNQKVVDKKLAENAKAIERLDSEISKLENPNQKLEALNQKVEALNQKIEATNQKVEATNQKIEAPNQKADETETKPKENDKKCRYYNRGFCKYVEKCRYFHPSETCEKHLENFKCNEKGCMRRHPKLCKWFNNEGGCRRNYYDFMHVTHAGGDGHKTDHIETGSSV